MKIIEKLELDPPRKLMNEHKRILIDTLIFKGFKGKRLEAIALYKGMPLFVRGFRVMIMSDRVYVSVDNTYQLIGMMEEGDYV